MIFFHNNPVINQTMHSLGKIYNTKLMQTSVKIQKKNTKLFVNPSETSVI
jgi:hypothetical protein